MREDSRTETTQARMLWTLMALCLIAAIAVSLFSPITWQDYFLSLTAQYGWPLVAAILTSAVILVVTLYAAKKKRTSGIVALSLFISMVLHMLAASFFGFMAIRNTVVEIPRAEKMQEISTGLPSLAESLLSQEARAKFNETAVADNRTLEAGKKSTLEPADSRKLTTPQPELKQKDMPGPEPERVKADLISKPRQKVDETLARTPDKIPDVNQAKVAMIKQVKPEDETLAPVKPVAKDIKIDPLKATMQEMREAGKSVSTDARLKETQREQLREKITIAAVQPGAQKKIEEALQKASRAEKANNLKLPPGTMAAAARTAEREASAPLAAKGSFAVSHQATATPDAPSVKRLSRELAAAPSRNKSASLADDALVRSEKAPTLKDASIGRGARLQSLSEPVRINDTQAIAARSESGEVELRGPTISARPELGTARSGQSLSTGSIDDSIAKPRASVSLQAGPATSKTFVSGRGGDQAPLPSGRSKIQDGLLAAVSRDTASHQLVDIGGNAQALQPAGTETGSQGGGLTGGDFPSGLALAKANTGIDDGIADSAPVRGRGKTALPARSSSSGKGTGVQVIDLDVPSALSQGARPGTGEKLAGLSPNASPVLMSFVDVGGDAVAATASAGAETTGSIGTTPGSREGRRELATGRNKTGTMQVEAGSPLARILVQEGTLSGSGTGTGTAHESLIDKTPVVTSGGGLRRPPAILELSPAGTGAGTGGGASFDARIMPGVAKSVQGEGPAIEPGSGGSDRQELARRDMRIGKVETGTSPSGGGAGKISRASLRTYGRTAGSTTSLVDSDVSDIAPSAGIKGSGLNRDFSLARAPGAATAAGGTFSLGLSAREAAGEPASTHNGTSSSGPSSLSEVRIAKAGGQLVKDSMPGGVNSGFDASSMSSSASRPPVRMEVSLAGGLAMVGKPAGIRLGNNPVEIPRTIISSELSDVPKSVPEKAIYRLRTPERRKEVIKQLGGSDKTEQAVERGLAWLAKAQSDDGRWDVDGFKTLGVDGGAGDRSEDDAALTGLCLLSYLGAGYTHVKGDYKETVRKALNWLVVGQKPDGDLQREGQMYGQAMATAAICECYSLTGDKRLLEPAEKAIGFILRAQNPDAGWRYQPRKDNDTSVTGWQVLALKSAMIAGIKIPPEHFQWVEAWLDKVRLGNEGGLYSYMSGHGSTPTMTAEGWFCQLLMREQTRTRGQAETIPYLMANQPAWTPRDHTINLYYWYYATLALHMSGAPEFEKWNKALTKALLAGQVKKGAAVGSWDPVCILGERGGRVYMTATSALCLEVYYRYLPFYKQK